MNERKKCTSLNSPKLLRFPKGKCMRAEALGWSGWKDTSIENNQSFPKPLSTKGMDWFKAFLGDGLGLASFSSRKWGVNQSPVHFSTSRDESWLLNESNLNGSIHPSNSQFETSVAVPSTSKAVFTILLPSTQILIVNSVACKLLGFTAEELCAMKLQDLFQEAQQLTSSVLSKDDLADPQSAVFDTGSVVELCSRDGLRIPVFLFLRKVETPQRCVAVAELVDRRVASVNVDCGGLIIGCDEEAATMFQYDSSEAVGLDISTLIPALVLRDSRQDESSSKQRITGRTKAGVCFPLCLVIRSLGVDGYHIILWVYSNLSGVIVLNKDLNIANCNHHFTNLLFGFSKESLMNQPISKLIPSFCSDGELGRDRTVTAERSEASDSEPIAEENAMLAIDLSSNNVDETRTAMEEFINVNDSIIQKDCQLNDGDEEYIRVEINDSGSQDCVQQMEDLMLDSVCEDEISSGVIGSSDYDLQNEITEKLSALNGCDSAFRVWSADRRIRNSRSDDVLAKMKSNENACAVIAATSNLDLQGAGLREYPMSRAHNVSNLSDVEGEESKTVREGTYSGLGRHRDGGFIDIVYRVKTVPGHSGYCVCVARDPWEIAEGGRTLPPNLTITSSFNSTSIDASMTKDSDNPSRPNSASIISQSDDALTLGEYSEYYTNLQQIGKGAFGYVKMAYRNADGLLVITKFIKKHKIHVRSWVVDPALNMKVPLEISLLTTLEHPNIVRVLDVFHNDDFFQLVMEKHGAGMDLFEFIDRKPKMDEKLSSYIFRQMVSAIHYLHSLGILHRDIKDENVIINEVFHVKLIDFGSAAFMTPDKLFSTFYGTVEYCSPEVLQGNKYRGPELEVWALGVTLYVLIFWENPFYDVEETIKGEFLIPRPLSSNLFSLLKGMLEKEVSARWDIDKIFTDPWVNQPVEPSNYSFQQVVKCYDDEAHPAQYIAEYLKESVLKEEDDEDRTVASSNSFCSLHTLENLDNPDQLQESFNLKTPIGMSKETSQRLLSPPFILSSTPRRASATKSVSPANCMIEGANDAHKRYSLDLNTLRKLCDAAGSAECPEYAESLIPLVPRTKTQHNSSKSSESVDSVQRLEFFDSLEHKSAVDEFENYWDAEDEEFDEDSF